MGEFRMPSLGADMEAGTLIEWLKQPGDAIARGEVIAVVETQKGAIEIEVHESGVIESLLVPVGRTVPVGTALAIIRTPDTLAPLQRPTDAGREHPQAVLSPAVASPPIERPKLIPSDGLKISPAARRFAAEKGIDVATISGSGPEGAIVFIDVENAWRQLQLAPTLKQPIAVKAPGRGIDLAAMRGAIAAAMSRSNREIPHYYVQQAVDIGLAIDWLKLRNVGQPPERRLVLGALIVKSVALAMRTLPEFNGFFREGRFESSERVHIGNAIALRGGGLVAPAIHDADRLDLDEVMVKLRDLVNRVRAGRYRSSELIDPTVTLTSLGERGADALFPIINPPQVAIIAAGTPARRPWLVGDAIMARPVMQLSLAADHRVSDGHRGALLLADITCRLTEPDKL
ncbi:MAG: dihydrolipoamide acetyltransferase family protein [Alphaproteobacteria bacterium]